MVILLVSSLQTFREYKHPPTNQRFVYIHFELRRLELFQISLGISLRIQMRNGRNGNLQVFTVGNLRSLESLVVFMPISVNENTGFFPLILQKYNFSNIMCLYSPGQDQKDTKLRLIIWPQVWDSRNNLYLFLSFFFFGMVFLNILIYNVAFIVCVQMIMNLRTNVKTLLNVSPTVVTMKGKVSVKSPQAKQVSRAKPCWEEQVSRVSLDYIHVPPWFLPCKLCRKPRCKLCKDNNTFSSHITELLPMWFIYLWFSV